MSLKSFVVIIIVVRGMVVKRIVVVDLWIVVSIFIIVEVGVSVECSSNVLVPIDLVAVNIVVGIVDIVAVIHRPAESSFGAESLEFCGKCGSDIVRPYTVGNVQAAATVEEDMGDAHVVNFLFEW